ncbi:hypothetical protein HYI05_18355 [Clostridium botulinum]|nr:hypothetical protein [Clostridium botulinum]
MTPKELAELTIQDIVSKRERAEREFYDYQKEKTVRRKKSYNIRFGGYRW